MTLSSMKPRYCEKRLKYVVLLIWGMWVINIPGLIIVEAMQIFKRD